MREIPNIRHLRVFCEVARRRSIAQAAEPVHLSQPAITQAIAKLEQQVAAVLFERRAGGMLPTEEGALFHARVERVLAHLRSGAIEAARAGDRKGGRGFTNFDELLTAAQLRALVAIAGAGNFSLAARQIHIAQPSIHRAARDLERLAGLALFTRTATGIALTAAASTLVLHVKRALAELDQGFSELAERRGADHGGIVIGSMPLPRTYILPTAILAMARERPDMRISVIDGPYDDLLNGLRHGEIDVLVGALRDPVPINDVEQEALFEDPLVVVARARHPLAGRAELAPADLAGARWVVPRQGAPARARFEAIFTEGGITRPPGLIESSSLVLVRGLLLGSDLLTFISRHQVRHELELGLLAVLPVALPQTLRPIGLTVRRDWRPTATQARFLEHLRGAFAGATAPVRSPREQTEAIEK